LPHDFTCSTCEPIGDQTDAFTAVLLTTVVFVLLSSEYPIAVIDCPEHDDEVAFNAKGEGTWDPLVGEVTVTLEKAGAAQTISARLLTVNKYFIRSTSTSPSAETACKIPLARESRHTPLTGAPGTP
jgi:hypothetical protein